jgi:PPK2 family polyphosphate:nucleotide phosphotransferase
MNTKEFLVPPGKKISLSDYDPASTASIKHKESAEKLLQSDIHDIASYQDILYAHDVYSVLMIFQAMDAAGKDGAIKHVMSGINPLGCQVYSFKSPSSEELDHDYLWRSMKSLPERGRFGIFNRSYYEEVLIVRVHSEILQKQKLPPQPQGKEFWKSRFREINEFERYLVRNGIHILKFFLNVSKDEQKRRFLKRIETPEKNWKFSASDAKERMFWDQYMDAYEDMFNHTSTEWAPWHIIPADHKWFTRAAVAHIFAKKLKSLDIAYPEPAAEHKKELAKAREMLEQEDGKK